MLPTKQMLLVVFAVAQIAKCLPKPTEDTSAADGVSLNMKFKKCSKLEWPELRIKLIEMLQEELNEHFGNTLGRFKETDIYIWHENEELEDNYDENKLSVGILVYSPSSNVSSEMEIIPKMTVAEVILNNRVKLEKTLNIVIKFIEHQRKNSTWVEAWFWPVSFIIIITCVVSMKGIMSILAQKSIYQGTMMRMEKLATSKEKRRIVMEYLQGKYDAQLMENDFETKNVAQNGTIVKSPRTLLTTISETNAESNSVLTTVDCDSSFKQANLANSQQSVESECGKPPETVPKSSPSHNLHDGFLKPGVKLPPVGTPGHHHIIARLMSDPLLDKEIRKFQSTTVDKGGGDAGQSGFCGKICFGSKFGGSGETQGRQGKTKANLLGSMMKNSSDKRGSVTSQRSRI